jgi:outer membrane protein insertion porin family
LLLAAALSALLFLLSLPATRALALAPAARGEVSAPIKVVVAVLPFRVHSAKPLDYLEDSLADLLATRLEASGRVDVLEALTVRESLVAYAGERTETAVRRLAAELGADFVVVGSLTELAGHYSLDVRVTPVASNVASSTMAFTADDDGELLDRINELASRVLELVGTVSPRARIAEVRVDAMRELESAARGAVRIQPGEPYRSEVVREDLERLRALPGVASATVDTERRTEGVTVTFRVVATEQIMPSAAAPVTPDRIAQVRVQGNRRIEASAIRARISTQPGDSFSQARVAGDVREVYSLGFFRNVRVVSEVSTDGRVLIFEVEENPVVRQVSITGNEKLDSEKIRDSLTLTTGSTLDYPLLYENRERIEAMYRAEGYYLAKVRYQIQELPGDAVAIDFEVTENEKLRLRTIAFEGNEHFSDGELASGLHTRRWRWWSPVTHFLDRSGTYAEPAFLQDLQAVQEKYLNAGFLRVEVGEPEVEALEDGLTVTVEIVEGDRFEVGKVDVAGDETVDLAALRERLKLKEGETFNRSYLTDDVEALELHYTNRGFYFASVNPRTMIEEDALRVDVTFEVEKGPLYFIREIDIAGNTTTIDPVIRREMNLVESQLYSARAIRISEDRIKGLGFFEEVNFEPRQTDYPDQLDLGVKVVEKPTGSLSFGAGYSSQDAFVVSAGLSQRNLFGRGYAAAVAVDIGGESDRFYISFADPYLLGSSFSLASTIFRTDLLYEDFREERSGAEFRLGHFLDEAHQARGSLSYSYATREVSQDTGVNAGSLIFRELLGGEESTSLFGVHYWRDTRDDIVAPTGGQIVGGSVEGAGLGGFSKFVRFEGRWTGFFRPPGWVPRWFPFRDKSSFVLGARFGYVIPFNDVSDWDTLVSGEGSFPEGSEIQLLKDIDTDLKLPLTERYFLGGIGTYQLRGFEARSVGPRRAILRRTGLFGTGNAFTPVGRGEGVEAGTTNTQFVCRDTENEVINFQGNGNGECNSLFDEDVDDFDDLEETDVIGGSKFFSASIEYRFPISESLGLMGIVFLDFGNAFAENESIFDVGKWRYGTGFGAQWFSPFGPLQAFVGFPLDKLEVEDSAVFEFSVGGASF